MEFLIFRLVASLHFASLFLIMHFDAFVTFRFKHEETA